MHPCDPKTAVARLMACAGLLFAPVLPAAASSATASFPVSITLSNPSAGGVPPMVNVPANATCVNQALSHAAHATVTVVCSTNQFVSIAPLPGAPYIGTHGGALRYALTPGKPLQPDGDLAWQVGTGTVTTLQVERRKWDLWDITEIQISY
jgi:hypothetical protein